jgi:hypothetical protein
MLSDLVCKSRPLCNLKLARHWSHELRSKWRDALVQFSQYAWDGMQTWLTMEESDEKDQLIFDITVLYGALPSYVLRPFSGLPAFTGFVTLIVQDREDEEKILNFGVKGKTESVSAAIPPIVHAAAHEAGDVHAPNSEFSIGAQSAFSFLDMHQAVHQAENPNGHAPPPLPVKPRSTVSKSEDTKILDTYNKGFTKKANKMLFSKGVATATPETAEILQKMHPRGNISNSIPIPEETPPPLRAGIDLLTEVIKKESMHQQDSIDPMGWAPHLFTHVRGLRKVNNRPPPVEVLALFLEILNSEKIPAVVAMIHTAGVLTGLNKLAEMDRLQRIKDGQPPKIRPINNSSSFAKTAARGLGKTQTVADLRKSTAPHQNGFAEDGAAVTVHLCRTSYDQRKVIHVEDGENAFNSLHRQGVPIAISRRAPKLRQYVNTFYGKRAPVFYFYREGDTRFLKVMWSEEGTRMGEHFASLFYGITAEEMYLKEIMSLYPEIQHTMIIDDVVCISKCPDSNLSEDWEIYYDEQAEHVKVYDELATPHGSRRVPEKSRFLIPPDAPLPLHNIRSNGVCLNVTRDGVVIAGSPIGTPAFMLQHAEQKIDQVRVNVKRLVKMGKVSPQHAMRMLGDSINHSLDYYVRVTPPAMVEQMAQRFDTLIMQAAFAILEPPDTETTHCPLQRANIARSIMRLPFKIGGLNLPKLSNNGAALFLGSLQSLTSHEHTKSLLHQFDDVTK